jgi:uracil-DNA glycosylase
MDKRGTFEELIKRRQTCTKCHNSDNLCHFETKLSPLDRHQNLLGPWKPLGINSHDSKILVVGQDFGIVQYLLDAKNIDGLREKECKNSTNRKLIKYLESAGIENENIYFTNAILCIKKGESNKTKSGTSMSAKVETDWFINCSNEFLKPLITDYLPNLKTIITLGKYALFSIEQISVPKINSSKPLIELVSEPQHIYISNKSYNLIPMLHPSFDHLSVMKQKDGKKAINLWEDLKNIISV